MDLKAYLQVFDNINSVYNETNDPPLKNSSCDCFSMEVYTGGLKIYLLTAYFFDSCLMSAPIKRSTQKHIHNGFSFINRDKPTW